MRAVARVWFRYRVRGLDRVPPPPCLFVAHHSGFGIVEELCLAAFWYGEHDDARVIHGLTHDIAFKIPIIGTFYAAIGAIPASQDSAKMALAAGRDVIVFPGGDIDACRPLHQPRRVVFGARRGYARLALAGGVPVVPIATIGSHWSMPMLPGGAVLSRVLGMKRWLRVERLPLPLNIFLALGLAALAAASVLPAWGYAIAALVVVPWPVRITTELLPSIDPTALAAEAGGEAEAVEAVHAAIHGAIQRTVATMSHRDRARG